MSRAFVLLIAVLTMVTVLTGCDKLGGGDVSLVKTGYLDFDKSTTVGQAFDGYKFFTKKEWKSYKTDQGRKVVEFKGLLDLNNQQNDRPMFNERKTSAVAVVIKFLINGDNTFQLADATMFGTVEDGSIQETVKWYFNNFDQVILQSIYSNQSVTGYLVLK